MDLYRKSYPSAADGGTATVMVVQAHTEVKVLNATSVCGDTIL